MIDQVIGQVAKVTDTALVVMVGGVGLRVNVPKTVLDSVHGAGVTVTLYTHLIVREDDLSLYGFMSEDERSLFETLLGVQGVGARTAISILSTLSIDQLRSAVTREEASILTRVPGIGKKTAEKLVFELKSKLKLASYGELAAFNDSDSDVIAALTSLGYSVVEAQAAVQSIPRDAPKDVESRIMIALQYFSA
ncbi:MAG: Holliday junction branch migration protein RuvA [Anaerolineae bacterium]|nr:Holliday junction branch migration protein RuvA [Anaerolineae bacterium]